MFPATRSSGQASPLASRRSLTVAAAAIFAFGAVWALAYLWHSRLLTAPALYEEPDIGLHLAQGHGFRSPYSQSPDAPFSSWSPPLYPYIVSVAYRVFGISSPEASVALGILNALCFGAVGAALFVLGVQLFRPSMGAAASVLLYLHPMFLRATGKYWDSYPALAIFLWLIVAAIHLRQTRSATLWCMAALGAGSGLLLLFNASYILAIPAVVLVACAKGRKTETGRLRPAGQILAAALACAVILTPWTIRNYVRFDQFIPIRGGANLELWFGNLPSATGWLNSNAFGPHPGHDLAERNLMLQSGEPAYFRYCGQRFWQTYHADPAAFWWRTGRRLLYVFFSDVTDPAHYPFMPDRKWHGVVVSRLVANSGVVLLGLGGAVLAWRRRWPTQGLLGIALLSIVPFLFTAVWDRHTMPLRSILLFFAALFIVATIDRWRNGVWPGTLRHRQEQPHGSGDLALEGKREE